MLKNQGEEITALWSRQSGKTETGKAVIIGLLLLFPVLAKSDYAQSFPHLQNYSRGFSVGFVGPTMDQASIPFKRFRNQLTSQPLNSILNYLDISVKVNNINTIELSNGSVARAMSAAEGTISEGESFHLLWFEESQLISRKAIFEVFHPMVAATNGTIVKVGTASDHLCPFFISIQRNKSEHPELHFEVPYQLACQHSPSYRRFIEQELHRLEPFGGENSDEFKLAYKLEWTLRQGMFILQDEFKMCQGEHHRRQFSGNLPLFAGIDLGKINDSTVVTILEDHQEHLRIIDWLELKAIPYDEQLNAIIKFVKDVEAIACDATGVGNPFIDLLKARLDKPICPVVFTPKEKDKLYRELLLLMRSGKIKYPKIPQEAYDREFEAFKAQFLSLKIDLRNGILRVISERESYYHDDYCDSLALALRATKSVKYGISDSWDYTD